MEKHYSFCSSLHYIIVIIINVIVVVIVVEVLSQFILSLLCELYFSTYTYIWLCSLPLHFPVKTYLLTTFQNLYLPSHSPSSLQFLFNHVRVWNQTQRLFLGFLFYNSITVTPVDFLQHAHSIDPLSLMYWCCTPLLLSLPRHIK